MIAGRAPRWWVVAGIIVLALCAGCWNDDDGGGPIRPTLDSVWPNADGNAWTYALAMSARAGMGPPIYGTPEEVPSLPSWTELAELLDAAATGAPADTGTGVMRLRFDGMITTEGGAAAQYLAEEYYESTNSGLTRRTPDLRWQFLRVLATARPDLSGALRVLPGGPAALEPTRYLDPPLFLHGYAWEKTTERIAGYGDLNDEISWLFLESNLGAGHEFTLQLVPELADDVYLHGRIGDRRDIAVETGVYRGCIECLYVVDYGVVNLTSESGGSLGYCRPLSVGIIVYAPGVGPVYSHERHLLPSNTLLGGDFGRLDNECRLIGFGHG